MIIWVVEEKDKNGIFQPTAGVGLAREQAVEEMNFYWRHNNPEYVYRVKKYISDY